MASVSEVEQIFLKNPVAVSAYNKFKKSVLKDLCNKYAVPVTSSPGRGDFLKVDYIRALRSYNQNSRTGVTRDSTNDTTRDENPMSMQICEQIHSVERFQDNVAQPSASQRNVDPEDPVTPKQIQVRLQKKPKDWNFIRQVDYPYDGKDFLELTDLQQALDYEEALDVVDPKYFRPYFCSVPGKLAIDELEELLDDGKLRMSSK